MLKKLKKKEQWNMRLTVIPIGISALGKIPKRLMKGLEDLEIRGQMETIQPIGLLRSAKIQRRVLETWGDLLLLKIQGETIH